MRRKKTNRVAMLVTITLPSQYPLHESLLTLRVLAESLTMRWAFIQARLALWGVEVWGMYLVEPHHDGVTLLRALVYCNAEDEPLTRSVIRDFTCPLEESLGVRILNIEHPHTYFKKYAKKRSALVSLWAWVWGISTSPVKFGDWS